MLILNVRTVQIRAKKTVWIKNGIVQFIIEQAREWKNVETGGILAGYLCETGFVVTNIVGPGPKAKHTENSFKPDNKYHLEQIARIYHESDCIETYLGDWHTHPNSIPYMSYRDKTALSNIAAHKRARIPTPLMLVLGTKNDEMKIWLYDINHKIEPCRIIFFD